MQDFYLFARRAWGEYRDALAFGGEIVDGVHDTLEPSRRFTVEQAGFGAKQDPPTLLDTMLALWLVWYSDTPRPPTQSAVAAGVSLLSTIGEAERCIALIMRARGLERSRP